MTAERAALVTLARIAEPGDRRLGSLVAELGPAGVLARLRDGEDGLANGDGLRARLMRVEGSDADEEAAHVDARIVVRGDREWPRQLGDLGVTEPCALWVTGAADLRLLALRSVAIVGARACTRYGEDVADGWAAALASRGWCVVSGGAYGIDGAAHRGALAADGATICVLAGGVDVRYPRSHDALLGRIAEDGLLVSEVPPGEPVRRQRFLERNRLIAALTRGTIVVEAALRSGTTATAAAAYAMNRPVVAVPGPISSPTSAGCHRMIRDGEAVLGTCIDDVLELVAFGGDEGPHPAAEPTGEVEATPRDRLSDAQRSVLDCLPARGSLAADDLVAAAGLSTSAAWTAVLALESAGWVTRDARGWRLARR